MQISKSNVITSRGILVVIKPVGKITLGEGTMLFRNEVKEALEYSEKPAGIILNFSDINYIDSSGIGVMVSSYTMISNGRVPCSVTNLTKKIDELLHATKLWTVFPVFTTEEDAVEDFEKNGFFSRPYDGDPSPYAWN